MNSKNLASSHPHRRTRTSIAKHVFLCLLSAAGCFFFVLLSLKLTPTLNAQTPTPPYSPTPTCTVTPTATPPTTTPTPAACSTCSPHQTPSPQPDPTATAIPSLYQPGDGSTLEWRPYPPTNGAPSPWPAVLVVHEGGFKTGGMYSGLLENCATDLASAGYYAFIVSYRLAPCEVIKKQPCHDVAASGRPPEQTDDIKAEVRAARADPRCNGKVAVVGGSAGGSHAAFVALDTVPSANWSASDRPDAAACLSGAYDLSDRTQEVGYPAGDDPLPQFIDLVQNYTNTFDRTIQRSVSPVAKVTAPTADKPFRPIFFINTQYDPMPFHQIVDLQCALQTAGIDPGLYKAETIPDSRLHAFQFWREFDDGYPYAQRVSTRVIDFFDAANLKTPAGH